MSGLSNIKTAPRASPNNNQFLLHKPLKHSQSLFVAATYASASFPIPCCLTKRRPTFRCVYFSWCLLCIHAFGVLNFSRHPHHYIHFCLATFSAVRHHPGSPEHLPSKPNPWFTAYVVFSRERPLPIYSLHLFLAGRQFSGTGTPLGQPRCIQTGFHPRTRAPTRMSLKEEPTFSVPPAYGRKGKHTFTQQSPTNRTESMLQDLGQFFPQYFFCHFSFKLLCHDGWSKCTSPQHCMPFPQASPHPGICCSPGSELHVFWQSAIHNWPS